MANSINTNIAAYSAQSNIGRASNNASSSIARLSSGNRIVRSSDDVAALSIGTSISTQVTSLRQALANTAQGASLLQVADGALQQISDILQRQKAIATQANSGTLSDAERGFLDQEFQALRQQIDQIAVTTSFSSVKLLDGTLSGANPLRSSTDGTAVVGNLDVQQLSGADFIVDARLDDDAAGSAGDTTFIGDLSTGIFTVDIASAAGFSISFSINGSTYSTVNKLDALTASADNISGHYDLFLSNGEGKIAIIIADDDGDISDKFDNATTADATSLETLLTDAFATATAYASRNVLTTDATDTDNGGLAVAYSAIGSDDTAAVDTTGTILAGFAGDNVTLQSATFNGNILPSIRDFRVVGNFDPNADAPGEGAIFSVTINGQTYSTLALDAAAAFSDATFDGGTAGEFKFYLGGDSSSNEFLTLDLSGLGTAANQSSQTQVQTVLDALNGVFGRSGGGLTVQVGANAGDTLSVSINNVSSNRLYLDDTGTVKTLSVTTLANAQESSAVLDNAIATINTVRANIGALQSRVNFTASNLQSAIQNSDAARGSLLDTDVATESTAYATSQVQLQAGIAVLAQANLLPQNLLKLIG